MKAFTNPAHNNAALAEKYAKKRSLADSVISCIIKNTLFKFKLV